MHSAQAGQPLFMVFAAAIALATIPGCGVSSRSPVAARPGIAPASPAGRGVAAFTGPYQTDVTLIDSGCGAVAVANNETVVARHPASNVVTLRHAGTTYVGAIASDSTFTMKPLVLDLADGFKYTIAISGKFKPESFSAVAVVDRASAQGGDKCRYSVRWAGVR